MKYLEKNPPVKTFYDPYGLELKYAAILEEIHRYDLEEGAPLP